jgi:two-component system response regulator AtoC
MAFLGTINPLTILPERRLPPDSVIFGRSPKMQGVRNAIEKLKGHNLAILIQGENGTGKEVVAMLLHDRSPWAQGTFVKVSCPSIPGTLLESELFGYERGAFTGAYSTKPGRVESAHGGTLFLDEIGELDLGLQAKLLQLLQDGQFSRIGGQVDKRVDLRVICATNRKLEQEAQAGTFRRDLFYRINVAPVYLPPLRERREDIRDLAKYFLETQSAGFKCKVKPLSPGLMQILENYDWPGNIRQLENLIKRYVILGTEEAITADLMEVAANPFDVQNPASGPFSLKKLTRQAAQDCERKIILGALQTHHWNRKDTARALRIGYRTLLQKMQYAGLAKHNGHRRLDEIESQPANPETGAVCEIPPVQHAPRAPGNGNNHSNDKRHQRAIKKEHEDAEPAIQG